MKGGSKTGTTTKSILEDSNIVLMGARLEDLREITAHVTFLN